MLNLSPLTPDLLPIYTNTVALPMHTMMALAEPTDGMAVVAMAIHAKATFAVATHGRPEAALANHAMATRFFAAAKHTIACYSVVNPFYGFLRHISTPPPSKQDSQAVLLLSVKLGQSHR
jgi:hypothetical protein